MPTTADFLKFQQFTKVEEDKSGNVVVWGVATEQKPDLDNEICSYEDAVPVYKQWSDAAAKRTKKAGQEISLGNVRLQHSLDIGGKATKLQFDDDEKAIYLGSVPLNDQIRDDLRAGYYTGYSQGGSYAWRKCTDCGKSLSLAQANNWCADCKKNVTVLYGLKKISEVSYVDSPASGVGFEYVKANGSREIIKFAPRSPDMQLTPEQIQEIANAIAKKDAKTKRVAGKDLHASDFAYVGDPEKTETWKLPIHDAAHCRNALARFNQTEGIPADEKPKVKAKIVAAAKRFGIEVSEEGETKAQQEFMAAINKAVEAKGLNKGLYEVSELARLLSILGFTYQNAVFERDIEGDESEVPDELKELLEGMVETFIHMAEEEARELAAAVSTDKTSKLNKGGSMTPEQQAELDKASAALATAELAKKKGMAQHFAKTAAHHEKMQAHHEKMAASHETMHDACKADVEGKDEPHASVAPGDYVKAAGAHHKAMMAHHEKCGKCHMAMADHCHAMSEQNDPEEHAKAVAAIKAADVAAGADSAPVVKTAPSLDTDVAAEMAKQRTSPEYKQALSDLAKAKLDEELQALREKTLAPDGVKMSGAGDVGGIRVVPRAPEKEGDFKFAATGTGPSSTGL